MKRKKPSFNEAYHGYRTFSELLEDAQKEGLLELDTDKRSRTYVVTRFGAELSGAGPPPAARKAPRRRRSSGRRRMHVAIPAAAGNDSPAPGPVATEAKTPEKPPSAMSAAADEKS